MMQKKFYYLIGIFLIVLFTGCGDDDSSPSSSPAQSYDDTILKVFAAASISDDLTMDRNIYKISKYSTLTAYTNYLKDNFNCSSGSLSFSVNDDGEGCGDYNTTAVNCIYNGHTYNGVIYNKLVKSTENRCMTESYKVIEDWTSPATYLGETVSRTVKTGSETIYTTNTNYTGDADINFIQTVNSDVIINNISYTIKDMKVYMHNDLLIAKIYFNSGTVSDGTTNIEFKNTGTSLKLDTDHSGGYTFYDSGDFAINVNSEPYNVLINADDGKVGIYKNNTQISNRYHLDDTIPFSYYDYGDDS